MYPARLGTAMARMSTDNTGTEPIFTVSLCWDLCWNYPAVDFYKRLLKRKTAKSTVLEWLLCVSLSCVFPTVPLISLSARVECCASPSVTARAWARALKTRSSAPLAVRCWDLPEMRSACCHLMKDTGYMGVYLRWVYYEMDRHVMWKYIFF